MFLSSKNYVRAKMHLEVWAAVCHLDFIFRDFHVSKLCFSSHEPSGSRVEIKEQADTRRAIARLSSSTDFFTSPDPQTHGQLIGWYSGRRAPVHIFSETAFPIKAKFYMKHL